MCGLAGIVDLTGDRPPSREALADMLAVLVHRGPDELGIYVDDHAGLAHARLSIVDLAAGQQPMTNEDRTLWLVFNGEIFNYVELREELLAYGHRFRTRSDTEVILHAWEQWGERALGRLAGQWAFALWDTRARELILARDVFGVTPLYIAEQRGRVAFASEVKALFAGLPELPRELDPVGLDETFTFWTVVAPRTVFRGIAELPPGHVRRYSQAGVVERMHATTSFSPDRFRGSVADAAVAVREALARATSRRLACSDVPVGSYLSGGLDSSLVAALAHAATGRLHTFSLRFDDAEYDETAFQREMVARLGSTHHEVVVTRADIAQVLPEVVWHAERPLLRTAPAPLLLLSRLVHDAGIKVVLTGEGADEMFAGYDLFREGEIRRFWAREPHSLQRPRLLERLYPYLARSPVAQHAIARGFFGRDLARWREPGFAHGPRWAATAALKRLLAPHMRVAGDPVARLIASCPSELAGWSTLAQDQYLEIRTLLSGYLLSSQGDRMLMASSVEGRYPFLDRDVVALAAALPDRFKLRTLDEKHVLKRAAAGLVPDAIAARKKQPYRAPMAVAGPVVEAALEEHALRDAGIFDVRAARALWAKCRAATGPLSNSDHMALAGVMTTQLLVEQFVRRAPRARVTRVITDRSPP
jgi:asparagine synthase (glutamine-hydrolysing)